MDLKYKPKSITQQKSGFFFIFREKRVNMPTYNRNEPNLIIKKGKVKLVRNKND
jgi:hypothetical protein